MTKTHVTKTHVIVSVAISNLVPSEFNPPGRTTVRATASLREAIENRGILSPLHGISMRNGRVAVVDGHRRLFCAISLKIDKVPVIIHDEYKIEDAATLWAEINSKTRNVSGYEWMYWWFHTGCDVKSKDPPSSVMGKIKMCFDIFGGRAGIQRLIEAGAAPLIGERAKTLASKIEQFPSLDAHGLNARAIGEWMLKHGPQSVSTSVVACSNGGNLSALRKVYRAVKRDRPINVLDLSARRERPSFET